MFRDMSQEDANKWIDKFLVIARLAGKNGVAGRKELRKWWRTARNHKGPHALYDAMKQRQTEIVEAANKESDEPAAEEKGKKRTRKRK